MSGRLLITLLLVSAPACGTTTDPVLEVGTGAGEAFRPLMDGDTCNVVWATQGGHWVMLRAEAIGVEDMSSATCALIHDATGEELATRSFTVAPEAGEYAGPVYLQLRPFTCPTYNMPLDGEIARLVCETDWELFEVSLTLDVEPPPDAVTCEATRKSFETSATLDWESLPETE